MQRKILFGDYPPTHPPTQSFTVQQHALASLPSPPSETLAHNFLVRSAPALTPTHSLARPGCSRCRLAHQCDQRTRPFVFSLPTGRLFAVFVRVWEFTVECSADSVASQTKSHHVYWRRRHSLASHATARRVDTSSQASRNRSAVELAAIGTEDASSQH